MKKNGTLQLILKGFLIGSSMSVPGVSGGTMAIILGIYNQMIQAVSGFFKDIKKNTIFLIKLAVGGVLGICSLSFLISWLLEKAPVPVSFFFVGAVAGGIPVILNTVLSSEKERLVKKNKPAKLQGASIAKIAVCFLIGLAAVIAIEFLPKGLMEVRMDLSIQTLVFWAITGVVVALALVLPGISTSHMLVVLGLYQATLDAIRGLDILFIACLGISLLVGVFATTKPLEWLMNKYTVATYSGILGFVVGSVSAIFKEIIIPEWPKEPKVSWLVITAIVSIVLFVAGIIFIRSMEKNVSEES